MALEDDELLSASLLRSERVHVRAHALQEKILAAALSRAPVQAMSASASIQP